MLVSVGKLVVFRLNISNQLPPASLSAGVQSGGALHLLPGTSRSTRSSRSSLSSSSWNIDYQPPSTALLTPPGWSDRSLILQIWGRERLSSDKCLECLPTVQLLQCTPHQTRVISSYWNIFTSWTSTHHRTTILGIKNISKFSPQGNFVSYLAANIVRSAVQGSVSISQGASLLLTGALNLHSSQGKSIQSVKPWILRESESYLEINSASSE